MRSDAIESIQFLSLRRDLIRIAMARERPFARSSIVYRLSVPVPLTAPDKRIAEGAHVSCRSIPSSPTQSSSVSGDLAGNLIPGDRVIERTDEIGLLPLIHSGAAANTNDASMGSIQFPQLRHRSQSHLSLAETQHRNRTLIGGSLCLCLEFVSVSDGQTDRLDLALYSLPRNDCPPAGPVATYLQ